MECDAAEEGESDASAQAQHKFCEAGVQEQRHSAWGASQPELARGESGKVQPWASTQQNECRTEGVRSM